ncbi:tetratricopeptide repeat protein (macronuclear) [Tetrahymena thermophila SB210]|uniref:Tetratricopeptide repeat protein n=1 Tax=Tetrahymena thermophila (strain SB210) TaxID=312017 RepID=W7XKS5_TETTS|nr:tetratricopeptide repeat protein [Tetrahymena thermophila SB210]EWS75164.1 tetratricopeptide repeat protein [Tetrahymena thermophila SB210]|eukprot:XP_012652320.1 tetratricopeptide repeat protein [Tetrahymena thermophila SB210]
MIIINGLLSKYQSQQLIVNRQTNFTVCSYRELIFNECPPNVYSQLNENNNYVDLYFVRSVFKYDLLSQQQQYFIQMNDFVSFYGKAAFYASQIEGLIQLAFIYNNDLTSIQYGIQSGFYNYTDSDYEDCLGDDFIEPYDPRCRPWFQFAANNPGYFFFEPYLDPIGGDILMTLSTQINRQNQLYSVNSIDIYMINLGKLFNSTQSQSQYSILLHEFNNTVFAHPLLNRTDQLSWSDLEFYNITMVCSNQTQLMEECQKEKESFQQQIDQTINFIKTGNYSVEQKYNLDSLYQYWSKFGDQRISMVYPIQSQIKRSENQKPYSYSIALAGRVISDKRKSLKLLNLINANYIQLPLILSFVTISFAIIIFIVNFAIFQATQIWYPIELLTQFLQKSLLQDFTCKTLHTQPSMRMKQKSQFNNQSSKKREVFGSYLLNKDDIIQNQSHDLDQSDQFALKSTNRQKQNSKNKGHYSPNAMDSPLNYLNTNRLSLYSEIIVQDSTQRDRIESQQSFSTGRASQLLTNQNRSRLFSTQSNGLSQEQDFQLHQKEEDGTNKILKGLKPMFFEMKVIKKTFQQLEYVINYSVQQSKLNSQSSLNTLFHFSKAKELFLKLNNQTGLSRCYFNLGLIHLLKYEFSLSSEYFQSAIQINLNLIGEDYQNLASFKLLQGQDKDAKDQLIIFTKRILSLAYSQKCSAFQQIYVEQKEDLNNSNEMLIKNLDCYKIYANQKSKLDLKEQNILLLLKESLSLFQKVEKIVENHAQDFSDIFKIFLYQEITEILAHQDQKQQILTQYIKKILFLFLKNNISFEDISQGQIDMKKNSLLIASFSMKSMISEAFKSKQLFLFGIIEKAKNNKLQAIEYLTQSLEIATHYDHFQKMKTIQILSKLFKEQSQKQDFLDEEYLSSQVNTPLDLIILLQLEPANKQSNFLQILEGFKKFNFLNKTDRIQIIVFNKQINQFVPYTHIKSNDNWKTIIDSLQDLRKEFFYFEEAAQKQLSLQQALYLSLPYIYELNTLNITYSIKNEMDANELSYDQFTKDSNHNYLQKRKKLLLLLSNGDIQNFQEKSLQKLTKIHKLITFHLKDNCLFNYKELQFQDKYFYYELLQSQNDLILKLTKLRLTENFDTQSVFLSVLNEF